MTFPVSTFADLDAQIAADLAGIAGNAPVLPFGVLPVLQKVLAKLSAAELAYLAALPDRALMPDSVQGNYLDRWAGLVGLKRLPAAPSSGYVQFVSSGLIGLPGGTQLQDETATIIVQTVGSTILPAGNTNIGVQSITPAAAANLPAGSVLTLLVGIAGVQATAIVQAPGLAGGADAESDAALQVRLHNRLSNPPQGGSLADYQAWAQTVNGVTRVFVYPLQLGPGTVSVTFMMDGRANPVPLAADVANVQAAINALAPVVGITTVFAPSPLVTAVIVASLAVQTGTTLATAQANVAAALAALNYITIPGGILFREQVYQAIANAPGVASFDLTAPAADVTTSFGQIVQLSAPTFT
jgi:uncharacterized phage protein gp47/JayE